jgi:alpha/beta superfamily hydrolase
MAPKRREVQFSCRDEPSVVLSGVLFTPEGDIPRPYVCVLVHPWGFLGGSRANTYPYAERLSNKHGMTCLIFDSRGVGESTGKSTMSCSAEIADVVAACDWVKANLSEPLVLVGSSAGAAVAGSALDMVPEAVAYVAIGYTFGWLTSIVFGRHFDAILKSVKPKLFIMGTEDGFTSIGQLESRLKQMQNAEMRLIEGVGHFSLESLAYSRQTADVIAEYISLLNF